MFLSQVFSLVLSPSWLFNCLHPKGESLIWEAKELNRLKFFRRLYMNTIGGIAGRTFTEDDALKTTEVGETFEKFVKNADGAIEDFIKEKSGGGQGGAAGDSLSLSAGESLQLQRLMGDQSITVQTGTSTLKSIKDSIASAARNI